jgi:peptidoglycan hydrolase CwlO-like protein
LTKVLTDYKQKHDEFSKAMKKSRETFRMYEGEIKNLTSRVNDLQQLKRTRMGITQSSGGGKKGAKKQAALE